jgi:hypothetical protein
MLPAKSRERKCSTCRHYQASPLWRKGWCRNPLLYDRNTNHLVEADSLACNRTFIDYWEPITEGAGPAGSSTRVAGKPRIAPSIPMQPVDAQGRPVAYDEEFDEEFSPYLTDELEDVKATPVSGVRPVPANKPVTPPRERPPLALVDDDYDELLDDPRDTKELTQVRPAAVDKTRPSPTYPESARERIARARRARFPQIAIPRLTGIWLYAAVGALAVLLVVLAAFFIFNRGNSSQTQNPGVQPSASVQPQPTPTGFGDPTPTGGASSQPSSVPVSPDTIAVGGYAVVTGTGDGLIVRSSPSRSGSRIAKLADGTKARVVDGPRESDGFTWWKLDQFDRSNPTLTGWSVQDYLKASAP